MSKEETKNTAATQETAEKVMTKYDRKVQKRKEEKEKAKREKDLWTLFGILFLVAIAAVVLSFPIRRYVSLHGAFINVGNENVTKAEFDYCYHTVVSNYESRYSQFLDLLGVDLSSDLSKQSYDATRSWKDYFEEMTVESLRRTKALKADAKANGFTKDVTQEYNNIMNQQKEAAKAAGISLNKFLQKTYGVLATESRLKPYLEEALYVNAYYEKLEEDRTPSADAVQARYEESPLAYDDVDYRIKQFNADLPKEPTELADPASETETEGEEAAYVPSEAEVAKAMADAKELAEAELSNVASDGELVTGISYASANDAIREWLFSDERKSGDVAVLEDTEANKVYAVAFEKRYRQELPTADIRILVADDGEQANQILNDWKAGGATDECFKDLCNGKYVKNSVSDDGLLKGVSEDADLFEELIEWVFTDGRKAGDCEVLVVPDETEDTYFVVYYVRDSNPKWYNSIENELRDTAVTEYVNQLMEACQVSDPKKNLNYLVLQENQNATENAADDSISEDGTENSEVESSAE